MAVRQQFGDSLLFIIIKQVLQQISLASKPPPPPPWTPTHQEISFLAGKQKLYHVQLFFCFVCLPILIFCHSRTKIYVPLSKILSIFVIKCCNATVLTLLRDKIKSTYIEIHSEQLW